MTYKAMKHIQNCDLLVLPDSDRGNCVAYQIVEKAWAGVRNKPVLQVAMPMTHDKARMAESHLAAARAVERHLDQGKQVVFLTLGILPYIPRISISTGKLQRTATKRRWYPACPLLCGGGSIGPESGHGDGDDPHHSLLAWRGAGPGPAGCEGTDEGRFADGPGETGAAGPGMEAAMVENCGMDGQRCFRSTAEIPEDAGYFSLLLVREEGGAR